MVVLGIEVTDQGFDVWYDAGGIASHVSLTADELVGALQELCANLPEATAHPADQGPLDDDEKNAVRVAEWLPESVRPAVQKGLPWLTKKSRELRDIRHAGMRRRPAT